jgi:hypothetical protein
MRRQGASRLTAPSERREIDLQRRVCVITPDVVDIRPAKSAAVVPMIGFLLGIGCFVAVLFLINTIPFPLILLLMGAAILLVPFSGMGFVYSIYGANVVVDRRKRTAVWQQGLFGMGVGTAELVPFEKIERLEVEKVGGQPRRGPGQDFLQYEVRVLKVSGRTLELGQVTVPPYLAQDGFERARAVGEAIAALAEKPIELIGVEEPRRQRYRRRDPASTTA